ncbi:MAG: ATP-binding protein [Candidatus Eremiobacteraeota bacterium]|nr:ATP-binding protein [Candidatus Eremiobacteraeota bacterium]
MIWKFDATDGCAAGNVKAALLKRVHAQAKPPADVVLLELVFSELVGNVARHAPRFAFVSCEWQDDGLVLRVTDDGPGFAHRVYLPENPLSESGRGLFLVESLSKRLDISSHKPMGTCVSVWLPIYCVTAKAAMPQFAQSAYSAG